MKFKRVAANKAIPDMNSYQLVFKFRTGIKFLNNGSKLFKNFHHSQNIDCFKLLFTQLLLLLGSVHF